MAETDTKPDDSGDSTYGRLRSIATAPAPAPPAPDARADIQRQQEGLIQKSQQETERAMGAVDKLAADRRAAFGGTIGAPAQPKLHDLPAKLPQMPYGDAMQVFQNPAILLATLGSLLTRTPATSAMNAASAAINGFHAGDEEAFERARQQWKDNTEQTIAQNKLELDKYNAAWKATDHSAAERQARMGLIAAESKDEIMKHALVQGDLEIPFKLLEMRQKSTDALEIAHERAATTEKLMSVRYGGPNAMLTPERAKQMAEQYLDGNTAVKQNIGRGIQGSQNLILLENEIGALAKARNMSGKDINSALQQFRGDTAFQRTAGTYGARVETAVNEVDQLMPQALDASKNLPRGKWVPINKLVQAYEAGKSDPRYYDFAFANWSLANAYARAINPTGVPRVEDKNHALELMSVATDPVAYETVLARMRKEVEASQRAVEKTRHGGEAPQQTPAGLSDEALLKLLGIE